MKNIIYQVFVRHFAKNQKKNSAWGTIEQNGCGKFNDFNVNFFRSIKQLGITHVWYTGVLEHASTTAYPELQIEGDNSSIVKGVAGSPYAVRNYYDVCPDLAVDTQKRMQEFENLIVRTHQNGMKVIIDFVPNHLARCYRSGSKSKNVVDFGENDRKDVEFLPDNNFYYMVNQKFTPQFELNNYYEFPAKVSGNNCFDASPTKSDWYETAKLNYGINYFDNQKRYFDPVPDTWLKMKDILIFWAKKGVDGFRCDMAEMVPVEFWHWAIGKVKSEFKNIEFIAEIYKPELYNSYISFGGFDLIYDKVGLYDTLRQVVTNNLPAKFITDCWQKIEGLQQNMLNFLENHDEQRIASDFFAKNSNKALPAVVVAALINTNAIMIYAGQELGERGMDSEGFSGLDGRSTIFDYWQPDTIGRWINQGKFDCEKLTNYEKALRNKYVKLLEVCSTEKAITRGLFYDLTYANIENPDFNSEACFAFIRKFKNEMLLLVVNFSESKQLLTIEIPKHAFDFLEIETNSNMQMLDLLSNRRLVVNFGINRLCQIEIDSFGYIALKNV